MRSLLLLAVLAGSTSPAFAELQWMAATHPYLEARSSEDESDASLRMTCIAPSVELRLGADTGVGNGEYDDVTLTLESKGKEAEVSGNSQRSPDYESTTGTELVTFVPVDHPVFAVFRTGGDVKVTGSIKEPSAWPAKGMKEAVDKFLAACAAIEP